MNIEYMKMAKENIESILTEAIDTSGCYRHLVEIYLDESFKKQLAYGKSLLSTSDMECTLNFYTESCVLYKLRERKEKVFPDWEEKLKETDLSYISNPEQSEEIDEEEVDDVWHTVLRIDNKAKFSLVMTSILDDDGAVILYETPWLNVDDFID